MTRFIAKPGLAIMAVIAALIVTNSCGRSGALHLTDTPAAYVAIIEAGQEL